MAASEWVPVVEDVGPAAAATAETDEKVPPYGAEASSEESKPLP